MDTFLSGIKDVNMKILEELDDPSLFSLCSVNKKAVDLCNNQLFWKKRFIEKYGLNEARYKPKERSWKNHYLQIFIDLELFKNNPMKFFKLLTVKISNGNKIPYYTVKKGKKIPIYEAPEYVRNNFRLLNLGKTITIRQLFGNEQIINVPLVLYPPYFTPEYIVNNYHDYYVRLMDVETKENVKS